MRQWNKETIKEQLKLHNKQNKDERYNYFSREFNSLWYCWELEKYTISLEKQLQQKENIIKDIKSQLDYLETYSSKEDVFDDMKKRLDRIESIINKGE